MITNIYIYIYLYVSYQKGILLNEFCDIEARDKKFPLNGYSFLLLWTNIFFGNRLVFNLVNCYPKKFTPFQRYFGKDRKLSLPKITSDMCQFTRITATSWTSRFRSGSKFSVPNFFWGRRQKTLLNACATLCQPIPRVDKPISYSCSNFFLYSCLVLLFNQNQILFTIFRLIWNRTKFRLFPTSVGSKYNLIPIHLTRIRNWFLYTIRNFMRTNLRQQNAGPWSISLKPSNHHNTIVLG